MTDSFVKRFLLTCNPWFLASTLFLLLGIYLVYVDPKLIGKDETQMYISFSSLQLYEILCLAVVFLFRKIKLYYDSVFLVVIISMLLFVPFITFNQALQYDNSKLELLGYFALIMASIKLIVLKVGFKKLNLPWIFLASAFLMLIMNFSLPFAMKGLNLEGDTAGTDFIYDVFSIAIPVIGFLGYVAMYNIQGGTRIYQSKWLPITLFQCFFTVTLINLMSVMYVYDIPYNNLFYTVTLLVSAFLALHPVIGLSPIVKKVILLASLVLAIIALGAGFKFHFILALVIILMFSISISDRWSGLISFSFLLVYGFAELSIIHFTYTQICLTVGLIITFIIAWQKEDWSYLILPAFALELLLMSYDVSDRSILIFTPVSLCLFITHIWNSESFKKLESFIICLSLMWLVVATLTHLNSLWEYSFTIGLVMLGVQIFRKYYLKLNQPLITIVSSGAVISLWPIEEIYELLKNQSFSIIVIISSFIIFIAGTYVTYTKKLNTP